MRELLIFSIVGSLLVLFLVVPVIFCIIVGIPQLPSLAGDWEALRAVYLSFHAATTGSILVAFFGTPLAYFLSRCRERRLVDFVESALSIPLALPHSVAGIMVLLAYNSRAPIGSVLSKLGLVIEDSYWGIVFAMMFVSAPIFVSTVRAGFDSVDVELENVARTLGATPVKTFFTVSLPLAFRHILAGFILTLARGVSEVGAVMIVAYYPKVAATLVIERFLGYGLAAALSLSTFLALLSMAVFFILKAIVKIGERE